MNLIADSGSTKTHWCLVENGQIIKQIFTKGINPFYQSENEIKTEIELYLIPEISIQSVSKIFFYGAGCSFPEKKVMVSNALGCFFKHISIEVQSDLLAASRALFGHNQGIACIMGTGSNSCFYDGSKIAENVSPLGFILGDEGSGAVLGKTLVSDCLKNQLSPRLKEKFLNQFEITPAEILENVYKKPFPNRFLAKFTTFLSENIQEEEIYQIVYTGFNSFVKRNIAQYQTEGLKVGFVGSIAYYFKDILYKVALENGLKVDMIDQSPMDGLVNFHKD